MSRLQQEIFKIFISHKLSDKQLAELVARELESLGGGRIDCWLSGQDLSAGVDWNRQTKHNLAESHLLVLLFTTPALNWDWCLFEVGLFTRFEADDVCSVVCLFDPGGLPPGPLNQVQGVSADVTSMVRLFLDPLCTKPWSMSDDWQRGALGSRCRAGAPGGGRGEHRRRLRRGDRAIERRAPDQHLSLPTVPPDRAGSPGGW